MPLDIKIKRQVDNNRNTTLTVELDGSLDTATAPQLEKQLAAALNEQVNDLIFDLAKLTFISSAGLRVFAASRKYMKQRDEQVSFVHMQPQIQEVFEIVKALPGVSVFGSIAEFDKYLATRQRKVQAGEQ
jgi:anti-anti-sigma factor